MTDQAAHEACILAFNADGEIRAAVSLQDGPWPITDVIRLLEEWAATDSARLIDVRMVPPFGRAVIGKEK